MSEILQESILANQIVKRLRCLIKSDEAVLHEPCFIGNEWSYVKACIDSSFVSSVGQFVTRFENDLATYTGASFAIAVVNGTAALHIALLLSGVEPGDEVLIPALTFIATANAVSYCGATPHLVDIEERTLGIDANGLREYLKQSTELRSGLCINSATGRVIRAIVPMHTFGHPTDMAGILSVARDFNLKIVEDAAESLGSTYEGQHTGTFGLFGTLSFNGNKTITTGGGGAILTNDKALAKRAKHITTTAKVPHRWEYMHDEIGYNYRMPNINAALGCAQLEQIEGFLTGKRRIFERYQDLFADLPYLTIMKEPRGCHSNYWLQSLILDESVMSERDAILYATNDAKLMTRPVWTLMHRLPAFKTCPRMTLFIAESLERRVINLPSSSQLINKIE
jgi:perosamine synthetase